MNTDYIEKIEIIIRALIIYSGKILFHHPSAASSSKYYYLPGGHLEKGETIEQCLRREFKEEMNAFIDTMKFLQIFENFYTDNKGDHHEINLLYKVSLLDKDPLSLKIQENHIQLTWLPICLLKQINILPRVIHQYLLDNITKWLK